MYILLGILMPHAYITLVILRLVGCMYCALQELFALLMCDPLSTPQLVSEQSAIVLAVSFLSNLLGLAYLLVRVLLHIV